MTSDSQPTISADREADPKPEKSLSQLVHDAAQPLSVLVGILELCSLQPMTTDENAFWMKQGLEQIHRATASFDLIRAAVKSNDKRAGVWESRISNV